MSKSTNRNDKRVDVPIVGHYTDKSFVIRGDREKWGKKLVVIGARWVTRIRGGEPGWLISKDRLEDLERIFGGKFKILSKEDVGADAPLPEKVPKERKTKKQAKKQDDEEENDREDKPSKNKRSSRNEKDDESDDESERKQKSSKNVRDKRSSR